MSNVSIIERIRTMADQLEAGELSIEEVKNSLLGHVEALEGVNYSRVKEAQWLWAQLENAIATGQMDLINIDAVVGWLRTWVATIAADPSS